jgi:hypothetical protein
MNSIAAKAWYYWLLAGITNLLLIIVFFFCTVNSLTSVPIDKLLLCFCPFLIASINPEKSLFTPREFFVIIVITVVAVLSSILNLVIFPMIFFPVIGLCFAFIVSKNKFLLIHSLYYALIIHIILGIILVILAFLGVGNFFVSTDVKGFDLYSAHGLTATVQTFGTLCIAWLMLYLLRKKIGINHKADHLFFIINTIGIILTFNRSTYLFWLCILFLEFPILFWSMAIIMIAVIIKFWNVISLFVFSSASIDARSQLLEGFRISYLRSNSIKVYLFGRGNNQISESIAKTVKWTTRTDLENGYAMLLHTYGIVGLLCYLVLAFYFIIMFLKRRRIKEAAFLFFYFFLTQYITQEFVSVTFYIFLAVMLLVYDYYSNPDKFKFANS